jgi:hypothetical protein
MNTLGYGLKRQNFSACSKISDMLRSVPAQVVGSKIVWLAPEPRLDPAQKVLVVWEDAAPATSGTGIDVRDLMGRLAWRGDALLAQQAQRDAW